MSFRVDESWGREYGVEVVCDVIDVSWKELVTPSSGVFQLGTMQEFTLHIAVTFRSVAYSSA